MYQKIEQSANSCVSQGSCIAQKANELFDRRDKVTLNRVQYSELGEEPCLLWWLAAKHLFSPPPGDLGQLKLWSLAVPTPSHDTLVLQKEIQMLSLLCSHRWIWSSSTVRNKLSVCAAMTRTRARYASRLKGSPPFRLVALFLWLRVQLDSDFGVFELSRTVSKISHDTENQCSCVSNWVIGRQYSTDS
jgi:hypothetical protein